MQGPARTKIPVLMFVLIEHLEVRGALPHLCGNRACWLVVEGPISSCQHFNAEFDITHCRASLVLSELLLQLLAQSHVLKHLRHFVHLVQSAFDFQLL